MTIGICVIAGVRGITPLAAFGLGVFAATSAMRPVVLAGIAARRARLPLYRGVVGRANGGMIVHLGIVVIAVGLAAASSFATRTFATLVPGQSVTIGGHVVKLQKVVKFSDPARFGDRAILSVDGGAPLRPAIDTFRGSSQGVSTPAYTSSLFED